MEVLALFGPTAVGKTAVAIAIAERLRARGQDAVAVSADAIQVYRGLEVLSGAASPEERAHLETRLVSFLPVTETWSAGAHAARAHAEIDAILAEGRVPIVVGGTGLYLRAALADLSLAPPPDPALRARLLERYDADPEAAHAELARLAPERAGVLPVGDRQRVVRALELAHAGADPGLPAENELWTTATRRPTRLIGLTMDRDALVARIDARCAAMLAAGAESEVRAADAAGASATARKALGFAELLAGDADGMRTRTRRYARRQMTWLRKLPAVERIDMTGRTPEEAAGVILPAQDR